LEAFVTALESAARQHFPTTSQFAENPRPAANSPYRLDGTGPAKFAQSEFAPEDPPKPQNIRHLRRTKREKE
jgi:hypothetical protein